MNPKELRIGNIVAVHEVDYNFNTRPITKTIKRTSIETVGNIHEEGIDYDYFEGETDYKSMEDIDGVPLTEEWLLRFGFDKRTHEQHSYFKVVGDKGHKMSGLFIDIYLDRFTCSIGQLKHFSHEFGDVHYIHQLQNLYFALTGEELTVKATAI